MGLKYNDLADTVLHNLSIDEFEPKTGESRDVVVVGIRVIDEPPGKDLYRYLNNSMHSEHIRDVETSPNPDTEGYYYVFFEVDRNTESLALIREIITDIEQVTGKLKWTASTHLTDKEMGLRKEELEKYFIDSPENYMSRDEWEQQDQEVETLTDAEEVLEFLYATPCKKSFIEERLSLSLGNDVAHFRVSGIGEHSEVMEKFNIHESLIKPDNLNMAKFRKMIGYRYVAEAIDNYIVICDVDTKQTIVMQPC